MSDMSEEAERHPELYYPTGDIVLRAPLPPAGDGRARYQLYRVHKVVLGLHSVAFSNMFSDASAGMGPTYDDLPMVDMPDKAQDLSCLLDCIYNPSHFLSKRPRYKTALDLSGAARLADKYMLDNLRADIVRKVAEAWPSNVFEWNVREAELEALKTAIMSSDTHEQGRQLVTGLPEPASAIMFAEEFGCREILPAAFLSLARVDVNLEWEDEPGDGVASMLFARWSCLDNKALMRYIRGSAELETYHDITSRAIDDGEMLSPACIPWWTLDPSPSPSRVRDDGAYPCLCFIKKLRDLAWPAYQARDPFAGLQQFLDYTRGPRFLPSSKYDLCPSCTRAFRDWVLGEQKLLWQQVPWIFRLDQPGKV